MKTVLVPEENKSDVEELEAEITDGLSSRVCRKYKSGDKRSSVYKDKNCVFLTRAIIIVNI